ncbi:MAG: DUF2587 domain-containing protein [Micrococcales bacterium]|nr:DUF2587 domain-containing protein [Micrococcales bacterium]
MSEPTHGPEHARTPAEAGSDATAGQPAQQGRQPSGDRVIVVTPEGMGIHDPSQQSDHKPADLVEQPAKVMRIGSMVKQLLEEVRTAPLDERGRTRLAEVHRRSIRELEDGLAPELVEELERLSLPFTEAAPSDAELRIAQAQLVGWLEGLFHGIQAALFAQQMAAQQQLAQMRRALPGGGPGAPGMPGMPTGPGGPMGGQPGQADGTGSPTGQYL